MAEPGITGWRVHLGAHKTASTHLAKSLLQRSGELSAAEVHYIRQRDVIRPAFREVPRTGIWSRRILQRLPATRPLLLRARADDIRGRIMAKMPGPGIALFSEENLIGPLDTVLRCRFYPYIGRLWLLDAVTRGAPLHLFLAIRSFDSFLPSVYAQSIKLSPIRRDDLDRARAHWLANPPSWHGLVRELRSVFPRAQLTVWDYADYRRNQTEILEAVAGIALPPGPELPPNTSTRTPSAEAIAEAEAVDLADPEARSRRVREIFAADHALQTPRARFDPLPETEKAFFREAFAADLARIDRDFPGMRLRF